MSEQTEETPLINSFTYRTIEGYNDVLLSEQAYEQLHKQWSEFTSKEKLDVLSKKNKNRATWISYYRVDSLMNTHNLDLDGHLYTESSLIEKEEFKIKAISILMGKKLVTEINDHYKLHYE